jgi:hypothetical protein
MEGLAVRVVSPIALVQATLPISQFGASISVTPPYVQDQFSSHTIGAISDAVVTVCICVLTGRLSLLPIQI